MGLSMEFYAGDANTIGEAFSEFEFDGIRDGTAALAYADLSLHLTPEDLDILSKIVGELLGVAPLLLSLSLIEQVGTIEEGEGGGADVVDSAWVEMIASLDIGEAGEVTARWIEAVSKAHEQQLDVTDAAIKAIGSLIQLCKTAIAEEADVIHAWYL